MIFKSCLLAFLILFGVVNSDDPCDLTQCIESIQNSGQILVEPLNSDQATSACCWTISPALQTAGEQPASITLQFTAINGSGWTTCSLQIYNVLRFQASNLEYTVQTFADLGPNNTIVVNSARVLIARIGDSSVCLPEATFTLNFEASTTLVPTASVELFYGLLLSFAFPFCCAMLTTCPGMSRVFDKLNLTRRKAKMILFIVGTTFGLLFLVLFMVGVLS